MNYPLVSVIIPNYNYARYLAQAVDSALAQTYPSVEVVVIDDGSRDDSLEVLRGYGERVRWFAQTNAGVAAARNRGIEESRGEYLAFLDSDDVWLPEKLEKQMRRFLSDAELGLVHCGFVEIDAAGKLGEQHLDGMEGRVAPELLLLQRPVILGGGSAVVVTKSAAREVGGFDLRLPPAEDWEFYYRVARAYKVGFVPEVLMRYRDHGGGGHMNHKRMARSLLLAFEKSFDTDDAELLRIRRQCYGKMHSILAGSFFRSGQYLDSARHMAKSLWLTPGNLTRALGFPRRWLGRRRDGREVAGRG